jgi:DNA-binding response OmpR family regulator
MRVLVVEDDTALGGFLQKGLALEGHEVDLVDNGEAALEMAGKSAPSLVLLDLGLPCRDGSEILDSLRRNAPNSLVLVLTGRSDVRERVRCLDLGADDFMLKPFSPNELMARCRALLRRRERFADPMLRFGGVELHRLDRTVHLKGTRIELTGKEFALLEFLMLRRGAACSRSELISVVWNSPSDARTNVVDVYITYLRKKLAAAPPEGEWASVIETVRGFGYRIRDVRGGAEFETQVNLTPSHESLALTCPA